MITSGLFKEKKIGQERLEKGISYAFSRELTMTTIRYLLTTLTFFSLSIAEEKTTDDYRNYDDAPEHVKQFYKTNHTNQTVDFVLGKHAQFLPPHTFTMSIWEAMDKLDTLVDESDPDIGLPQSYHLFQTAEAMRKDGMPRWFILTGFIHDLGKILAANGEPQWAVVGDTFPVGCPFSTDNVYPGYFVLNVDFYNPMYQNGTGIYARHCGLDNVVMSWGHDEYLYQVVKDYLPEEAAFIIRYHSFYALHQKNAYSYLLNDRDRELLPWLKLFQKYDLYSKSEERLNIEELMPYYKELVGDFFPNQLKF